jgi:NO-binding membrane sensor protein with MHYT domain
MNGFHGMHGTYDAFLVGLSIVIAVLASFTALTLAGRVKEAVGRARMVWLVGAATALGGGIWSMHFVAMLAFSLQMPIQYNVALTAISLVAAIVVTALALYTVTRWSGLRSLGIAGFFAGIGVATMHYMGMAAMEMNATVSYDPLIFGASIVIAVVAATAALWLALNLQAVWHKVAAALVMGAAICGMHYTGMAAAIFTPADGPPLAASSISALRPRHGNRRRDDRHLRARHHGGAGRSPVHGAIAPRARGARQGRARAAPVGTRTAPVGASAPPIP